MKIAIMMTARNQEVGDMLCPLTGPDIFGECTIGAADGTSVSSS